MVNVIINEHTSPLSVPIENTMSGNEFLEFAQGYLREHGMESDADLLASMKRSVVANEATFLVDYYPMTLGVRAVTGESTVSFQMKGKFGDT